MRVELELRPATESQLRERASLAGVRLDELVSDLVEAAVEAKATSASASWRNFENAFEEIKRTQAGAKAVPPDLSRAHLYEDHD